MFKRSYAANPPKIHVPVWCLNADLWPTKSEVNRKYVPEFNLRIMPGVGHFLMLEKPEEFNQQLNGIVEEIAKRK
jgi:pimeloyl-ACP methyl ester carboxylesterase